MKNDRKPTMKFKEAVVEARLCCKMFPDCEDCRNKCANREVTEPIR